MSNEIIIAERFGELLKSLAEGTLLEEALQQHKILWREVESIVLSSPDSGQRWREARLLGKACKFSVLEQDKIFSRLARGVPPEIAVAEVRGPETAEEDTGDLFELVAALPDWMDRYTSAMRVTGLRGVQKLGDIVSDNSKDILVCEKRGRLPNPVPVQRARLQWEHDTYFMGKWNPELFGERKNQVNVQVNLNHAERLEDCRERARLRGQKPEQLQEDRPRISREQMDAAIEARFIANANAPVEQAVEPGAQADHLRNVAVATLAESEASEQPAEDDPYRWINDGK